MKKNMRNLMVLASVTLLGACALGGDYKRPPLNTPESFRGAPLASGQSLAEMAWWQIYQDPALNTLLRAALENNYDVRIALTRIDEFRAVAGIAGEAALLCQWKSELPAGPVLLLQKQRYTVAEKDGLRAPLCECARPFPAAPVDL